MVEKKSMILIHWNDTGLLGVRIYEKKSLIKVALLPHSEKKILQRGKASGLNRKPPARYEGPADTTACRPDIGYWS